MCWTGFCKWTSVASLESGLFLSPSKLLRHNNRVGRYFSSAKTKYLAPLGFNYTVLNWIRINETLCNTLGQTLHIKLSYFYHRRLIVFVLLARNLFIICFCTTKRSQPGNLDAQDCFHLVNMSLFCVCLFQLKRGLCVTLRPYPTLLFWWMDPGVSAASTSGWSGRSWRTWSGRSMWSLTRPGSVRISLWETEFVPFRRCFYLKCFGEMIKKKM